ncbi:dUTP diphosphatase [Caryophanon tenue]|uniref:Deoxyuridine 5'-triphosphate nucleotidohydrolase n=1 Tax=Caryophanon tenue TaxID=33978 RepID=A0A1C0YK10_9BACL|nr:dUTP diphosphatase [Caryophanon tenue]OCS87481.1 deoxyuridine 5'-triphosphate nucleotidohydrolase [Caryophanon tenue]
MQLRVKRVHEDAKMPLQARAGDAGMDLFSIEETVIQPGEWQLIKTGLQIELPQGTEGQVRPRSGLALKHGITVLNSPGTIDEGYRGDVGVVLINHGRVPFTVEKHMRIAQLVVQLVPQVELLEVEELTTTERGAQGFGSSGVK